MTINRWIITATMASWVSLLFLLTAGAISAEVALLWLVMTTIVCVVVVLATVRVSS